MMLLDYGLAVLIAVGLGRELRKFRLEFAEFKGEIRATSDALKDNLLKTDARLSTVESILAHALEDRETVVVLEVQGPRKARVTKSRMLQGPHKANSMYTQLPAPQALIV